MILLNAASALCEAGSAQTTFASALQTRGVDVTNLATSCISDPRAQAVKILRVASTGLIMGVYRVSVPVVDWCADDESLIDELTESCDGWKGYDCTDADKWTGSEKPYTAEGLAHVQKWCSFSCGFCQKAPRTPTAELMAPTCQDDANYTDFCKRWRGLNCNWATQMGYPTFYQELLLSRCPMSCGSCTPASGPATCEDTPGFVDEKGNTCDLWNPKACGYEQSGYGYTRHGVMQVQANCRASCGICEATPSQNLVQTSVPGYYGNLYNSTGAQYDTCEDDSSYSYIKLFSCMDFIGKFCTIGTLYLTQRWMMGPGGSGVGPWGVWLWHKPLWDSCPVSCGLCDPPARVTPEASLIECEDDEYFEDWCQYRFEGQDCYTWELRVNVALTGEKERYNTTLFDRCPYTCGLCTPPTCAAGTRRDKVAHECVGCTEGRYAATARTGKAAATCSATLPGDYVSGANATSYSRCEPGYFSATAGSIGCDICPPGRYSDMFSAPGCTSCELGFYQDEYNATSCKRCPAGTYANQTDMSFCYTCPMDRTTFWLSAVSLYECACPEGTYQPLGRVHELCEPCPGGMRCPGGHPYMNASMDFTGLLTEGHMSLPEDPWVVYTCMGTSTTCPGERAMAKNDGEIDVVCKLNRNGVRCADCPPNSYQQNGECKDCGDDSAVNAIWKGLLAVLLALYGTAMSYRKQGKETTAAWMMVMAFVSFVQVLQALSKIPLDWPNELTEFFKILQIASIPGFFTVFELRSECIMGTSTIAALIRDAAIPLIPFFNFGVIFLIFLCLGKKLYKPYVLNVIASVIVGFFVSICAMAVQLFPYEQMPAPNTKRFVRAMPGVELYSSTWYSCLPITLLAVVVYCGGSFVYVLRGVVIAPRRVTEDETFAEQYDFILGDINPAAWWWIVINLSYAFILSLIQAISGDVFVQIYMSMLLLTCIILIQLAVQPNVHRSVNNVEITLSLTNLVFLIFATAFFKEEDLLAQDTALHAWIMIAVIGLVLVFTVFSIINWVRDALKSTPLGKAARVAFRARDVMTMLSQLPESKFLGLASQMQESDRQLLKRTTDMLVGVFLKQQASKSLFRQRVIPGAEFKVWDPAGTAAEAYKHVRSKEAHKALEENARIRGKVRILADDLRKARIGPVTVARHVEAANHRLEERQEARERAEEIAENGGKVGIIRRVKDQMDSIKKKMLAIAAKTPVLAGAKHFLSVFFGGSFVLKMTCDQYLKEVRKGHCRLNDDELKQIFNVFDVAGDGKVGISDFFHLLSAMAPPEGYTDDDEEQEWDEKTEAEDKEAGGMNRSQTNLTSVSYPPISPQDTGAGLGMGAGADADDVGISFKGSDQADNNEKNEQSAAELQPSPEPEPGAESNAAPQNKQEDEQEEEEHTISV